MVRRAPNASRTRPSVGGQTLGEGGCGRVLTMDELPFKGVAYDVMTLGTTAGGLRAVGRARSLRELAAILGMSAVELFATAVYKVSLHVSDSSDEVMRTAEMLRAVAQLPKSRGAWTTIARTLPLLQTRDSAFAVALREVHADADREVLMPLYARMHGSLFDLRGAIAGPDVLQAVRSVLDALAVLRDAGVHHRDVKDENVLWRMVGSKAQYVLSDFGHLKSRPSQNATASMRGTEGFMSPLMYGRDKSAMEQYQSHMLSNVALNADAVWRSYHAPGPGRLSPSQQLEKNDLYAVGIMLYETFHGPDQGGHPDGVREFADALIDGSKARGLWTIAAARKRMQLFEKKKVATRSNTSVSS